MKPEYKFIKRKLISAKELEKVMFMYEKHRIRAPHPYYLLLFFGTNINVATQKEINDIISSYIQEIPEELVIGYNKDNNNNDNKKEEAKPSHELFLNKVFTAKEFSLNISVNTSLEFFLDILEKLFLTSKSVHQFGGVS